MHRLLEFYIAVVTLIAAAASMICTGCGSVLSAENPVSVSLWHVYGAQTSSPMEKLVSDFNETEGRKKGVIIHTTNLTGTNKLQKELLDAQKKSPGAGEMPDLFNCTDRFAKALGTDNLANWTTILTEQKLDGFVNSFLEDGMIDGRLTVLPLTKSTQVCFINHALFQRFSRETGAALGDLTTWDGFFKVAEKYYDWSGGKPFCSFDYPLLAAEMAAREQAITDIYADNGWYDTSQKQFLDIWRRFAEKIGEGHIILSDPFGSENVMTGEVCCSMGSSAGILYYNDTVTYEDGTVETLELDVTAMPHADSGSPMMAYTGVGLSAAATSLQGKMEAESVFVNWITEPERNLEFCAETGYIPVMEDAFEQISQYSFENDNYQNLFHTINDMYRICTPYFVTQAPSYTERQTAFYTQLRHLQETRGAAESPEAFADKTVQLLLDAGEEIAE